MRTVLGAIGLLGLAACQPVPANDTDRAAARALMVSEIMEGSEVPRSVADEVATCALDRMSDAQVRDLLAATNDDQRETVMEGIDDQEGMVFCMLGSGILEGAL